MNIKLIAAALTVAVALTACNKSAETQASEEAAKSQIADAAQATGDVIENNAADAAATTAAAADQAAAATQAAAADATAAAKDATADAAQATQEAAAEVEAEAKK
ncbi:hypothetical protein [Aquilutibacter rugosus]|uniref:hypothetical protein n=1 Tax=Aquilutibacter rugosus TaxID=3115820 RepID=UPI002F42F9CF